jgi:hypothetical protein
MLTALRRLEINKEFAGFAFRSQSARIYLSAFVKPKGARTWQTIEIRCAAHPSNQNPISAKKFKGERTSYTFSAAKPMALRSTTGSRLKLRSARKATSANHRPTLRPLPPIALRNSAA